MTQPEPSINFKCEGGSEFDAQLDGDGDLYIGVTNDTTTAMYLSSSQAFELRNWLTKVLAEFPQLCPHGMPLAESVCGPCSEGRPNAKTETKVTRRWMDHGSLRNGRCPYALEWNGPCCRLPEGHDGEHKTDGQP